MKTENKKKKNEESLCDLWTIIKKINLQIIGVPEGEESKKEAESLFQEIITENFPNLGRKLDIRVYEAHKLPDKIGLKNSSSFYSSWYLES